MNPIKSRASSLTTSVLNVSDRGDRFSVPFGVAIKGASRPNKGVPIVSLNPLMEAQEVDLKRYSTTII